MKRIALLGACLLIAAAADAPVPNDFAYALPLRTDGRAPLYRVALPAAVYEGVTRLDLADLCVFDADGRPVPYALRRAPAAAAETREALLPLFPIVGSARTADDLAVRVERRTDGTIVSVHSARGAPDAHRVIAYVADASGSGRPLRAVSLQWVDPKSYGFVGRVRIDGSNDLREWFTLASDAPVSRLRHGGRLLEQRRVRFSPTAVKYLRIAWTEPADGAKLVSVTAELIGKQPPPTRAWMQVPLSPARTPATFRFTLPRALPVDRVRVGLPPGNGLYDLELLSRADAKAPWNARGEGLVYRLQTPDGVVSQDELAARAAGDTEWLVRAAHGPMPATLTLAVGFTPQEIVFVPQGRAPFELAYGSARAIGNAFDVDQLLQPVGGDASAIAIASTGAAQVRGGDAVMHAPVPRPWRQWLLWSVLIAGVALLGGMALRLVRQMNAGTRDDAAPRR